jgi:uncharacterized repeat protein (TIGR04042 family)
MPEMHFLIRWPDGGEMRCYSPSLVVREHIEVGRTYPVAEFVARSRTMLEIGSERVRAKFGFACSSAMDQLALIQERAADHAPDAAVTVVGFELPPGFSAGPSGDDQARTVVPTSPPAREVGRG